MVDWVEVIYRLISVLMLIGIIGLDICVWVLGVGHGVPIAAAIAIQFISIIFMLIIGMMHAVTA